MKNHLNTMVVMLALVMLALQPAYAADSYKINDGATTKINEFGTCAKITNNHASNLAIFVPTKTTGEWSAFRSNRPSGVTSAACCGGDMVGGYCWYYGAMDQSCTEVCSARGGVVLAGIRDYAGSEGTNANCQAVLDAIGAPGTTVNAISSCNSGHQYNGCNVLRTAGQDSRGRCTNEMTTAAGSYTYARRACSCVN